MAGAAAAEEIRAEPAELEAGEETAQGAQSVDLQLIWEVIRDDLRRLQSQVVQLLAEV